jgi:hypothetical protein
MILQLIFLIIVISITSITIFFETKRYLEVRMNFILVGILHFVVYGILYPLFRFLVILPAFDKTTVIWLWRISVLIFSNIVALYIIILDFINSNRITQFLNAVLYALGGYTLSITFLDPAIYADIGPSSIYYVQPSFYFFVFALIFLIIFFVSMNYRLIFLLKLNKRRYGSFLLGANLFFFIGVAFPMTFSYLYPILYSDIILIYVCILMVCYSIAFFKNFEYFLSVFNIAYEFIIFHKSGIMLFSYDFNKREIIDTPIVKGAVLIGINHILSEFTSAKDQITSLNLKDRRIILEYNREYGYAIMLIVKRRTDTFEKSIELFSKQFAEKYKNELESYMDLNTAIDTSAFEGVVELVEKIFSYVASL